MTRSTVAGSARFRQKKLTPRQTLQILREDQIDQADNEDQRNVPKVDTGVEKGEEIVSWLWLSHPLCDRGLRSRFAVLVDQTDIPDLGTPSASCIISSPSNSHRWEGRSDIHPHSRCYPKLHPL